MASKTKSGGSKIGSAFKFVLKKGLEYGLVFAAGKTIYNTVMEVNKPGFLNKYDLTVRVPETVAAEAKKTYTAPSTGGVSTDSPEVNI